MSKSPLSEKKFMSRIAISGKEILLAHSYEDSQITINEMVAFVDRAPALRSRETGRYTGYLYL